jgi:four helix bundle protein
MNQFDHQRLDVGRVELEVLVRGQKLAKGLPTGYGSLADQLRRALVSMYLNTAEAIARKGRDRAMRLRIARGEANEAAAAIDAIKALELIEGEAGDALLGLLARVCAMLVGLERKA